MRAIGAYQDKQDNKALKNSHTNYRARMLPTSKFIHSVIKVFALQKETHVNIVGCPFAL